MNQAIRVLEINRLVAPLRERRGHNLVGRTLPSARKSLELIAEAPFKKRLRLKPHGRYGI